MDDLVFGDDERSIERDISCIQKEMKKKQVDMAVVEDSMKRMAAHRQKLCHERFVQDVITMFPPLQMKPFVSLTFLCFKQ